MFAALHAASLPEAALVDVARAFSPRHERRGPLVIVDASGLTRLFGSPRELGEHLMREVQARGADDAAVAVAPTHTAAALLALGHHGLHVVSMGDEAQRLAPLGMPVLAAFERLELNAESAIPQSLNPAPPHLRTSASSSLQALKPSGPVTEGGWSHPRHTHQASRSRLRSGVGTRAEQVASRTARIRQEAIDIDRALDVLRRWGIHTLGALAALPRPEVYERLGARGVTWQRRAIGEDDRPLVPWVDEAPFEAVLELEWPIEGLEPLSFVLARLLEPLTVRLEQADRGAVVLHTVLRLTTRAVQTRTVQLPAPMRDPKTLRTLILLDLESHPPEAPIDTVRVLVEPTQGRVLQWTLLERAQPAPEQVSTLLARLTALMGAGHVGSPQVVDSWRPGAFAMRAFEARGAEARECVGAEVRSALRRFRLPVPARVQVHEGRPVRVATDRHGLTSGAIIQSAGPWRTSGEWWTAEPSASPAAGMPSTPPASRSSASSMWDRDEWDVALGDGTIYRLFVEREIGQWFLDGMVD